MVRHAILVKNIKEDEEDDEVVHNGKQDVEKRELVHERYNLTVPSKHVWLLPYFYNFIIAKNGKIK